MKYINLFQKYIFLKESRIKIPKEFNKLYQYALSCKSAEEFDDKLNWNKLGHDRDNAFMGERFRRLNLGYRITEDTEEWTNVYRTGEKPIVWGDYVYPDIIDAESANVAGQGIKIYTKRIKKGDIVMCTQGSGEAMYSPRHLASFADDLHDFWYKVTDNPINTQYAYQQHTPIKRTFESDLEKLLNRYKAKANNRYIRNEFRSELISLRHYYSLYEDGTDDTEELWLKIQATKKK
jgi:hypothetical protein